MTAQIPQELRALPQWVVAYPDAIPLNPRTGWKADPTQPASWGTFEQSVATGLPHVGFVLSSGDPYTIIDLDDKVSNPATDEERAFFAHLIRSFDSYTEVSRSGRGYHIVVRGNIGAGRKHGHIEIYSQERYIIMTGAVCLERPVAERQGLLDQLVARMPASIDTGLSYVDQDETMTDQQLIDMAANAANGDKFRALWYGDIAGYPSQSEADYALLSMFTFYTKNNEQVRRCFRYSALGQRDKATRDNRYIDYALRHLRAKEPPPIDFSSIKRPEIVAPTPEPAAVPAPVETPLEQVDFAPGFLGYLQHYIYSASERPVGDIALAAAIAIMAGIAGRAYNVSQTGLNQYILLLANTGTGKNEISTATERIMAAIGKQVPSVIDFCGPAGFASGQALIRRLSEQPCFVSVLGEVGHTLRDINDPRAIGANLMLRKVLLDVYMRSGEHGVLSSTVYADSEKNTKSVKSPALTILGETEPTSFFAGIGPDQIANGLLPRFLTIHYLGGRPPKNPNKGFAPPDWMIQHLMEITVVALGQASREGAVHVQHSAESVAIFDAFDLECDNRINASADVERHLWNRAHLKALKLAALAAVCDNPHNPVINEPSARWAIALVTKDINAMTTRFATGDVGQGDAKQLADIRRVLLDYFKTAASTLATAYGVPLEMQPNGLIPFVYLQRRTASLASFRADRQGSTAALKRCVEELISTGEIQEVAKSIGAQHGYTGRIFVAKQQRP